MTPESCCHDGIAMLSGEMPPPLSAHAVSDFHGPAALAVVRSVPPTDTTYASSAGHASFLDDQVELSPEAAKKFWPCGQLLEVRIECAGIRRRPAPRAADSGGQGVVRRHRGSRDGMNVEIKGPVSAVQAAFHVNMHTYQHPTEGRVFYAPDYE